MVQIHPSTRAMRQDYSILNTFLQTRICMVQNNTSFATMFWNERQNKEQNAIHSATYREDAEQNIKIGRTKARKCFGLNSTPSTSYLGNRLLEALICASSNVFFRIRKHKIQFIQSAKCACWTPYVPIYALIETLYIPLYL